MRSMSKICTIIGCVLLFCAFVGFGFYEMHRSDSNTESQVKPGSTDETFSRYVFVDQHEDGSNVNVNVYAYDGGIYLTEAYQDMGGQWAYRHVKLDDQQKEQWYDVIENPTMAEKDVALSNKYQTGELFFSNDKSDLSYQVEPFSLADYGYQDPWDENWETIGDLPDRCKCFQMDAIKGLLGFEGNARPNAYVDSLFTQMADIVFAGESGAAELAEYSFKTVTLDAMSDQDYVLRLESQDGDYQFLVTIEGYVLGQK